MWCMCGGCADCMLAQGYTWEEVYGPPPDDDEPETEEEARERALAALRGTVELFDGTVVFSPEFGAGDFGDEDIPF